MVADQQASRYSRTGTASRTVLSRQILRRAPPSSSIACCVRLTGLKSSRMIGTERRIVSACPPDLATAGQMRFPRPRRRGAACNRALRPPSDWPCPHCVSCRVRPMSESRHARVLILGSGPAGYTMPSTPPAPTSSPADHRPGTGRPAHHHHRRGQLAGDAQGVQGPELMARMQAHAEPSKPNWCSTTSTPPICPGVRSA